MNKIRVSKEKLLDILRKNRDIHCKESAMLMFEYKTAIKNTLNKLAEKANAGENVNIKELFAHPEPHSYEKDYNDAIGMLELCVDATLEIDKNEYRQFVLDDWNWKSSFAMSKTAYGME